MLIGPTLADVISTTGILIRAQRRYVDNTVYASYDTSIEQGAGSLNMKRRKCLGAVLAENANGVDHRIHPVQFGKPRRDIGVACEIDISKRIAMNASAGIRTPPSADDSVATILQGRREVLPDESGRSGQQYTHDWIAS
jgi:hypothetical protein